MIAALRASCAADYIISGSSDGTGSFHVDDDLDVLLNGTEVYTDGVADSGDRAPIDLTTLAIAKIGRPPKPGDALYFQVRDTYGFCNGLSPLYLSCMPGGSSVLAAAGKPEACGFPPGDNGVIYHTSLTIPVLCPAIEGTVKDVVLNFPQRTSVALNLPLPGATVRLLDSSGTEVDSTTTDASGHFGIDATPPPGSYTVEVSKNANVYSSSTNSFSQVAVKQVRQITLPGSAPVVLNINVPVSIVSETATNEFNLNNLPPYQGIYKNPFQYNTAAVEAQINAILAKSPPPDFNGVYNGTGTPDDWSSLIRIDVAMETLAERSQDAAVFADDFAKSLSLFLTLQVFKNLGPTVFRGGDKTALTRAVSAAKVSALAFGVNFVVQPLLSKFGVPPAKRALVIEIYAKAVRFGLDLFIGKFKEDLAFELLFQNMRLGIYQFLLQDFIASTQPALDTAAIQFAHDAISADTNTTLAAIEAYDAKLSNFRTELHGIASSALTDVSVLRGIDGVYNDLASLLGIGGPAAGKISTAVAKFFNFIKAPETAAVYTGVAVACFTPVIGDTLLADPTGAVITAAMTGADALPPPPAAAKAGLVKVSAEIADMPSLPLATTPTPTPAPTRAPSATPTPVALPSPVQAYINELNVINGLLTANNVAGYAPQRANLLAADTGLFNYLTPIAQRASAALPNLTGAAATAATALGPNFDVAATDISMLYSALELWTVARDSDSQSLAISLLADVIADLDIAGPQAALVQKDMIGVRVPGQVVIAGAGVPAGEASSGGVVSVDYSFTNVGDQPVAAGTATLVPDANVRLLTSATVSIPALAAGGTFLASWQFRVSGSGPVDFGHYQVNTNVRGTQSASVDDLFVIRGGPAPTPTPTPVAGAPVIDRIPPVIEVGNSFNINGLNFTAGSQVNFFVATSAGAVNAGPLIPSAHLPTVLTVKVPPGTILGNGFVAVQVVNTDKGFVSSNLASALLRGFAGAGIPSITSINGVGLAATSSDPRYATDNVETVVPQGAAVTLGGTGFDVANGVAINLFCACPGGRMPTIFINHGDPGLSATQVRFVVPASTPTGPGSFVVINAGPSRAFTNQSNAVIAPLGQKISITSVTQVGGTITVTGTGFSALTVINFYNSLAGDVLNLGGLGSGGAAIPLRLINANKFTFTEPPSATPGPSYVEAFNPPFVPFTSSGGDPGGAFTLK